VKLADISGTKEGIFEKPKLMNLKITVR